MNVKSGNAIFTVANIAYLPKALALGKSIQNHTKNKLKVVIFDKKLMLDFDESIIEIIWIENLDIPEFKKLAFKYDIVELSTSLKAHLAMLLLKEYEKVIFLDPDTYVYSDLVPIWELLNNNPIILTPHYIKPGFRDQDDIDQNMLRFGSFNLGFFAVNSSVEAFEFLSWWSKRCIKACYFETQFGLSTDQKWVSIAPCFFPNIHISFDMGLNVAMWNLCEREITYINQDLYVNKINKLLFFHYSSFDCDNPHNLSTRLFIKNINLNSVVIKLALEYSECINRYSELLPKVQYAYDYMDDGRYISPSLRRAYASIQDELPLDHNPFESKGAVANFAMKNNLFEKGNYRYEPLGFSDKNKFLYKFIYINMLLRVILKIVGPNKFYNLTRLLVFLSSYRLNRDLWKY